MWYLSHVCPSWEKEEVSSLFFLPVKRFVFIYMRTEDVAHWTDCKAHGGNVIVILGYINRTAVCTLWIGVGPITLGSGKEKMSQPFLKLPRLVCRNKVLNTGLVRLSCHVHDIGYYCRNDLTRMKSTNLECSWFADVYQHFILVDWAWTQDLEHCSIVCKTVCNE